MAHHFEPLDAQTHRRANAGSGEQDLCRNCHFPFMDHNNGICPDYAAEEAAPDLLAALKVAEDAMSVHMAAGCRDAFHDTLRRVRAAVAKAEGR